SARKFGFFSSKCTCVSTMRSAVFIEVISAAHDTGDVTPSERLNALGKTAAAPTAPKNFRRDIRLVMACLLVAAPSYSLLTREVVYMERSRARSRMSMMG